MNIITIIGRLTAEPTLKYLQSGTAVGRFTVAVDRPKVKDREQETDFINVLIWGKQAENCANYLGKGRLVGISGRLQISSYEAQDGTKRRTAEVVANQVQFLDRAKDGSAQHPQETHKDIDGIDLDNLPF